MPGRLQPAALVLAGGASQRMGRPKALLDLGGETFVARLIRVVTRVGASPVVVVTGVHDAAIRLALATSDAPVRLVHNPAGDRGQLGSLLVGLDALESAHAEAVLVAPVDVPGVREDTVAALVEAWRRTRAPVTRPSFDGRHGHPVVFDRAVFADLVKAPPDQGARSVVRGLGAAVVDVPVGDEMVAFDVDTPEDYERLREMWARGTR